MSKEKNLKAKLSFLIFIVSICSFAMLQGFELSNSDRGSIVKITITGPNPTGCNVIAKRIDKNDPSHPQPYTFTEQVNANYLSVETLPIGKYRVSACNPQHGDNGIIIVEVKNDPRGDGNNFSLPLTSHVCAE